MNELTFEEALDKLEEIANQLEEGLTLEESLKAFEEGIGLFKYCAGKLERAEQKVQILRLDEEGEVHLETFTDEDVESREENED